MHPMNQPRYKIRKSAPVQRTSEDLKVMKSVMNVVGASAMCQDGSTTAGELQRILSDGTARISESSRLVNKSGHYADGFTPSTKNLMKMHVDGSGEPPMYSLARTMLRKGYTREQCMKMLELSESDMSKVLMPG
jgi:hypothetical protein